MHGVNVVHGVNGVHVVQGIHGVNGVHEVHGVHGVYEHLLDGEAVRGSCLALVEDPVHHRLLSRPPVLA